MFTFQGIAVDLLRAPSVSSSKRQELPNSGSSYKSIVADMEFFSNPPLIPDFL